MVCVSFCLFVCLVNREGCYKQQCHTKRAASRSSTCSLQFRVTWEKQARRKATIKASKKSEGFPCKLLLCNTAASLFFLFFGKLTFCASSFFTADSLVLLPSSAAAAAAAVAPLPLPPLPLPTPAKDFSTQPSQRPPVSFFFVST